MAEQATGTVEGTGTAGALEHGSAPEHNPGRPVSWAGTSTVVLGFIVGGIALVPVPHWVVFWVGAGIAILGFLILTFSKAVNTDWY